MAADGAPAFPDPASRRPPGEGPTPPEELPRLLPAPDHAPEHITRTSNTMNSPSNLPSGAPDPSYTRRPAYAPRSTRPRATPGPRRPRTNRGRRGSRLLAPFRSRHRRWFAAGSAGALAAAVGIAVAVQSSQAADCALSLDQHMLRVSQHQALPAGAAAATSSTARKSGKATFYGPASPGGNCSYPQPPDDKLTAAAGPAWYAAAAGCGGYVDVTGAKGTVRVKIDNKCPECGVGHFDLSNEAFAKIDDPVKGIVPITYEAVRNPVLSTTLSFRVKEGSSQWWFALLVDGAGNPLKKVEVSTDGSSWTALRLTDYNYWLAPSGAGKGPFTVRVTDIHGQSAEVSGIQLAPTKVQKTSTRLYGSGSSSARPTAGTGTKTPTARPTASPTREATVRPTPTRQEVARSSARGGTPTAATGPVPTTPVPTTPVGDVPTMTAPTPVPDHCLPGHHHRS
jgi:expansin